MGGVGKSMKIMFAMWVVCSIHPQALPGMSGFISELMVFVGFATDTMYLSFPCIHLCSCNRVILTPIYLLSMLREIFFGKENLELVNHTTLSMQNPERIHH